ncbi:GPN-loop GTPase 1 [Venturia inaequalis]|nr:GPN-loop GTPase 1 [Venturia inaequalis]
MVREIKGLVTTSPYEKSQLVIQGFNDVGKDSILY